MTSYMLLVERIAALKAEIERKDEVLKEVAKNIFDDLDSGKEYITNNALLFSLQYIAHKANNAISSKEGSDEHQ